MIATDLVRQFYATQVHALDDGDFDGYAATFGPGSIFRIAGGPTLRGRDEIVGHSLLMRSERSLRGAIQRHYMFDYSIRAMPSGTCVRACVLTVESSPGRPAIPTGIISCEDLLTPADDGGIWVESRNAELLG
ncbi:SnoaL-like domain-containing protein [Nocardia nova SH22a]|uniref:SnoaL-like domain-containing protein n=1 Tax=Nocardia nova SH22a TaxID=1415166 RepID=W5T9W1_9NOCA|nr:nuclear transport factor 2 family protein [Nocardia nova]AHH15889.1 SnoaL-like domain-containing protein [Nocardia nova SH22a]